MNVWVGGGGGGGGDGSREGKDNAPTNRTFSRHNSLPSLSRRLKQRSPNRGR